MKLPKIEEPLEQHLSEDNESSTDLYKLVHSLKEEIRTLTGRIDAQDELIKKFQKKNEYDSAQYEAKLHLLSSKVKLIDAPGDKREFPMKPERRQEEGLLSKLGISANHLAYQAYNEHSVDSFENY